MLSNNKWKKILHHRWTELIKINLKISDVLPSIKQSGELRPAGVHSQCTESKYRNTGASAGVPIHCPGTMKWLKLLHSSKWTYVSCISRFDRASGLNYKINTYHSVARSDTRFADPICQQGQPATHFLDQQLPKWTTADYSTSSSFWAADTTPDLGENYTDLHLHLLDTSART